MTAEQMGKKAMRGLRIAGCAAGAVIFVVVGLLSLFDHAQLLEGW